MLDKNETIFILINITLLKKKWIDFYKLVSFEISNLEWLANGAVMLKRKASDEYT